LAAQPQLEEAPGCVAGPPADVAEIRPDRDFEAKAPVLVSGAKALALAQIITQLARFGTNVVLAHLLAPRDFGLIAIGLVVILFLDQFRDLGTGVAVIQRKELSRDLINAVFFLNVLLGLALGLILLTGAGPITQIVSQDGNPNVLRAFAAITVLASLGQIHHALLRRDLRFRQLAFVTTADAVVNCTVSIFLAVVGFGVWALVIGTLAGALINTSAVWYLDRWRPSRHVEFGTLRSIAGFSIHLFGSNFVNFFSAQSDKILVARFLGASALGIYGMATRILTYPLTSIAQVVAEVSFPAFARRQDDDAALRRGFLRATSVVALITFPLMAIVAAVARPAVDTVFGNNWRALTPLIWILAPIGAIQSVSVTANQILLAKGKATLLFRWVVFYSTVMLVAYIVGLHWGLVGLCLGSAIAIVMLTPLYLMLAFRTIDLPMTAYLRALMPIACCATAAAAAAWVTNTVVGRVADTSVVLTAGVIAGSAMYALTLLLVRPQALSDVGLALQRRRDSGRRGGQHRRQNAPAGGLPTGFIALQPGLPERGRHRAAPNLR
jgi:PST family polysaccharide transporter